MINEEISDTHQRDADIFASLCSERDRLVRRMVAKTLECSEPSDRRANMLLLSSLIARIEACPRYDEGQPSCAHCREITVFRKRVLEVALRYDLRMNEINGRLGNVVEGLSERNPSHGEPLRVPRSLR